MKMAFDKKYEKKPGDGSAFKNNEMTEDWHFPYTGEIILPNGDLHYLNIKPGKTKAGEHWFQVKIGKPKTKKQDNPEDNQKSNVKPLFQSEDSDIPF
jgi:hypothetical protein